MMGSSTKDAEVSLRVLYQCEIGAAPLTIVEDTRPELYGWEVRSQKHGHQIGLSAHVKGAERGSTLLHELIHAVERAHALKLTEGIVHTLEVGLAQVLRSNPKMTKDLIEDLLTPLPKPPKKAMTPALDTSDEDEE